MLSLRTVWCSYLILAFADIDHDPVKEARDARKARVAKNERQKLQNDAAAAGLSGKAAQEERKKDIDRTLSSSRISTASMGKFDKKLDGEKKIRGVKRKVRSAILRTYNPLTHVPSNLCSSSQRRA